MNGKSKHNILQEEHTVNADNPWPGLTPYNESDKSFFHGRNNEIDVLHRSLLSAPLTVFFGESGLGKTSLLQAGLFPCLRQQDIFPIYIRLDFSSDDIEIERQVYEIIKLETERYQVEAPKEYKAESLWEYFHRMGANFWDKGNRLLLPLIVFDQFEEIFTYSKSNSIRKEKCDAFFNGLGDLVEGRPPLALRERLVKNPSQALSFDFEKHYYKILICLREDFLPDIEGLRENIPSIIHDRFRLHSMNGVAALEVVSNAKHIISLEVAEKVVRFVAKSEEHDLLLEQLIVDPALLSVFCRELNNRRKQLNESQIDERLLGGSKEKILKDFYERSVNDLPPEVHKYIEEELLTISGSRDSKALENAIATPGITHQIIKTLVDRRLIRIEERNAKERIELTHDRLTDVIRTNREYRHQLEYENRLEIEKQEAIKKAREKAEKERIEHEKEIRHQEEKLAIQFKAAKNQKILKWIATGIAAIAAFIAIWGFYNRDQARTNLERYLETDANKLYKEENFKEAKEKLEELLKYSNKPDSIKSFIKQCIYYDSIGVVFYVLLNKADSLIKIEKIDNYIQADSLYNILSRLDYVPGKEKLVNKINSFEVLRSSLVLKDTEIAVSYINADGSLIEHARNLLHKILVLDPYNPEAKRLLNIIER